MTGSLLIVDDSPAALKLLSEILGAEGYKVRPFSSGELALRSLASEPPDLVLLDVRMPVLDGIEACRRIKADQRFRDIPVLFISAAAETGDKLQAFAAGGVDYITKPFQREEVVARVRTHVTLYHAKEQLVRTELALRKSEQNLKIAQAVAHLGHWEMDVETREVHWSDETYRIFGFEPKGIRPSYDLFLQAIHPEDRERVASQIEQIRNGGEFDLEFRLLVPGAKLRIIHGKGMLVTFPNEGRKPEILGTVQRIDQEVIGVVQDITTRKELEWRLEREAHTDALTGCATRRFFLEVAQREVHHSHRHGRDLTVLMLDLDHFKQVNDAFGHHVGDVALQKLAGACGTALRQEDLVGRLGGEEFAILLPDTQVEKALEVAERLRKSVAEADVPVEGRPAQHITVSIGIARLEPFDPDIDALLQRADKALYQAKCTGRNRVVC